MNADLPIAVAGALLLHGAAVTMLPTATPPSLADSGPIEVVFEPFKSPFDAPPPLKPANASAQLQRPGQSVDAADPAPDPSSDSHEWPQIAAESTTVSDSATVPLKLHAGPPSLTEELEFAPSIQGAVNEFDIEVVGPSTAQLVSAMPWPVLEILADRVRSSLRLIAATTIVEEEASAPRQRVDPTELGAFDRQTGDAVKPGLDRSASAQRNPPPAYPTIARRRGHEGRVEFRVEVLAGGTVGQLVLVRSSGHDVLDAAARDAVARWIFRPAMRGGVPVASWIEVPVVFQLER